MSINPPPSPSDIVSGTTITPVWALWFTQLVAEANAALTGPVTVPNGGTGLTGYMTGDLPYASALNVLSRLAIGANGTVLTSNGTVPGYAALPATINAFALAAQPTLGAANAGFLGFVTDYGHAVYFDGTNWQFADGDQPGRFADFAVAPSVGWALCDGSATSFLVVGSAALSSAPFTTPNLKGTPSYRKSASSYSGTINAASGSTATGTTGTGVTATNTTGTGTTATTSIAHGHSPGLVPIDVAPAGIQPVWNAQYNSAGMDANDPHSHAIPALTIPALAVTPGLSVPALGVGTLDMPNLGVLPYVRR